MGQSVQGWAAAGQRPLRPHGLPAGCAAAGSSRPSSFARGPRTRCASASISTCRRSGSSCSVTHRAGHGVSHGHGGDGVGNLGLVADCGERLAFSWRSGENLNRDGVLGAWFVRGGSGCRVGTRKPSVLYRVWTRGHRLLVHGYNYGPAYMNEKSRACALLNPCTLAPP